MTDLRDFYNMLRSTPLGVSLIGAVMGNGGAGGGSIVYTNAAGDFIATPTVGAKTITITGLPFTLDIMNVAAGSLKKITSTGAISSIQIENATVSGGVISLPDLDANFASGDQVLVTLIGPDKAYDKSLDIQKVVTQNPEYAHTTSVETLIDEVNIAGATAASDAGGDATHIVDADGAFSVANIAVGYEARDVTENATVTVISLDSTTQLTTDAVTSWSGDTYRLPLVKRYEINMDTYKNLSLHYRLTNGASLNTYLKIYGTLDASATVDADTGWVDMSTAILGAAAGVNVGASASVEAFVNIASPVPMLKYMVKLVVECTIATVPTNTYKLFIKKA